MVVDTVPFDAADHLRDPKAQSELLADALQSGDPAYIAAALATVSRARGLTKTAEDAGVGSHAFEDVRVPDGNPRLSTVLELFKALGLRLTVMDDRL